MLENILPKDYLDYTTAGLQFISDCVKQGVRIPVLCFLNKTTREFVSDLEELEIGVTIMRPQMGENLEEWMETLNSMNAQNRWRLGLSRDTLTGGGGDIRKSVMVVPFSQNLLVDTDVKQFMSRLDTLCRNTNIVFLWSVDVNEPVIENPPGPEVFDQLLPIAEISLNRERVQGNRPSRRNRGGLERKVAEIELNKLGSISNS